METKRVCNNKNKYLTFLLVFSCLLGNAQIKEPVNLSFNINKTSNREIKKIVNNNKQIDFYINDEHFKFNPKTSKLITIDKTELNRIELIQIDSFKKLANNERRKLIAEGEKRKNIKILFNHQIFERIYLYEKTCDSLIIKYPVKWIEEIE